MAIQKGKRKRRVRRPSTVEAGPAVTEPKAATPRTGSKRRPPRTRKPLSERSALFPAVLAVLCLGGFVFALTSYISAPKSQFNLYLAIFYLVLAVVEAFLVYRVLKARRAAREARQAVVDTSDATLTPIDS